MNFVDDIELTSKKLAWIRKRAIRSKAWFRLEKIERSIINLTIITTEKVKSEILAGSIKRILFKLGKICFRFEEIAEIVGKIILQKLIEKVPPWYRERFKVFDAREHAIYLGVNYLTLSKIFKAQIESNVDTLRFLAS